MNIFVLDLNPYIAAKMQCDKHVVKMVLESAQLLCTAHRVLTPDVEYPFQYRKTHFNHPCSKWLRQSTENYEWLVHHFVGLCHEYTRRYNKTHMCEQKFLTDSTWLLVPPNPTPYGIMTPFAQAMPDEYKNDDVVKAYRDYYYYDKYFTIDMRYAKGRDMPQWLRAYMEQDEAVCLK